MSYVKRIFAICGVTISAFCGFRGHALALSPQPSAGAVVQEVHVTAIVPPMRHIIISTTGQILRITSNTAQDVTPVVYIGNDIQTNERPLTQALFERYRELVPSGSDKVGVLYSSQTLLTSQRSMANRPDTHIFQYASLYK